EDGIRDRNVTGVQTCALPISKNTLIFFTDYQCPVCPRAARELDQLVADFDGTLRVELHHNPLAMHKNAYDAAAAAKAAQRQGKRSEERRVGKEWRAREATKTE